MTSLAEFASLSLADLTVEIAAMQKTFTPVTAGLPSRDAAGDLSPLDRAVTGNFSTVTRSGTGDPSPVDAAVRGELIEDRA